MKFSDIIKKGNTPPEAADLIEGGIGIDTNTGLVYSKKADGTIFSMGNGIKSITYTGGTTNGEDTEITIKFDDATKADKVFTVKAGVQGVQGDKGDTGDTGPIGATFSVTDDVLTIDPN